MLDVEELPPVDTIIARSAREGVWQGMRRTICVAEPNLLRMSGRDAVPFQTRAWNRVPVSSWKIEDDWMSFSAPQNDVFEHCAPQARASGKDRDRGTVCIGMETGRYPALIFFRWREKRALSKLIVLAPANAAEALQKLVYLIAVMVADPGTSDAIGIANAIKTLKPFEGTLAHCLSKRRMPFQ